MFNPFKKKDNSFKLDDIALPSLNENNPVSDSQFSNTDLPPLPSLDNQSQSANNDFNSSIPPSPDMSSPMLNNDNNNFGNAPNNDFNQNSNFGMDNSFGNPITTPQNNIPNTSEADNSSIHNDIAKAKLESLNSKVTLIDARMQNMENKLEMIYQILINEISDETKRKLNIQNMMKNIRE